MTYTVESLGFNRFKMFPKFTDDCAKGRMLVCKVCQIKAAQDRVAMRRYIRKNYPLLSSAIRGMDERNLSNLIDEIRLIRGGGSI